MLSITHAIWHVKKGVFRNIVCLDWNRVPFFSLFRPFDFITANLAEDEVLWSIVAQRCYNLLLRLPRERNLPIWTTYPGIERTNCILAVTTLQLALSFKVEWTNTGQLLSSSLCPPTWISCLIATDSSFEIGRCTKVKSLVYTIGATSSSTGCARDNWQISLVAFKVISSTTTH